MKNQTVEILYIEDNPYEAKLAIASFKEYNLANNLVHIDDGAEALDFIFAKGIHADRPFENIPKVILLDLNLPKVGGLEVLRQIKSDERTKLIPVVILSSSKEDKDILTGYQFGVNSYVVKPLEFESFAKAVADLGLYWMALNQAPIQNAVSVQPAD